MASVVLLSFFSWSLCCLSFFDLGLLLSFCSFSLGYCVFIPSLILGFCFPFVLFLLVIVLSVLLWFRASVVLLSFFSWSSCCLPFFDLGLLLSFFLFLFVIVLSVLLWSTASVVLLCFFSWSLCCLSFFDLRFLLSCCPFSLGDCVVCPSLIYGFCCPVVLFLLVIVLSVLLRSTVSVVLLSFFSSWLCCLSFFDLRFLLSCCPFSLGHCVVSCFWLSLWYLLLHIAAKKISKFSLKLNVFVSAYNKEINMSGIYFQSRWNFMNMHTHMF